ncbi:hypothetical protein [Arenicella xantha]|uniref:Uncharacterized protein n=1 Tax=Arenicella xantha TaxID=644221 RepID=A0A395JK19_9GAMM|nr:hypothetical protein [Arenicella xantha]RBP51072.1 hypothetical protein DFR28_102491 [Arenicella xantha]
MHRSLCTSALLLLLSTTQSVAQNKVVVVPLLGDEDQPSTYQQSGDLNNALYDIFSHSSHPFGTPIGPSVIFNKQSDDTALEAFLFSHIRIRGLSAEVSAPFCQFTLLANGSEPSYYNRAGLDNDRREDEVSLWSVYQNLPKGVYEFRVYAWTNSIALDVGLDPNGYGGRIIVKETR